jgi:hypothetical protein
MVRSEHLAMDYKYVNPYVLIIYSHQIFIFSYNLSIKHYLLLLKIIFKLEKDLLKFISCFY